MKGLLQMILKTSNITPKRVCESDQNISKYNFRETCVSSAAEVKIRTRSMDPTNNATSSSRRGSESENKTKCIVCDHIKHRCEEEISNLRSKACEGVGRWFVNILQRCGIYYAISPLRRNNVWYWGSCGNCAILMYPYLSITGLSRCATI